MRRGLVAVLMAGAAIGLGACGEGEGETGDVTEAINARIGSDPQGLVLASAETGDGRTITLRAETVGGGGPCLTIEGVEDDLLRGCGRAPSERVPSKSGAALVAEATAQRADSAPIEVYGATQADATEVMVSYSSDGKRQTVEATLLPVVEPDTLAEARIEEPFAYFFAEVPAGASKVRAAATGAGGEELGSVTYDEFSDLHPRAFILGAP